VPLEGEVTATGEILLPPGENISQATGALELTCKGCRIPASQLSARGHPVWASMTLPDIDLGQVRARITLGNGNLALESLTAEKGDITLKVSGSVRLRHPIEASVVSARIRVRLGKALLEKSVALKIFYATYANKQQDDGSYLFTIQGPLRRMSGMIRKETAPPDPPDPSEDPFPPRRPKPLPADWATRLVSKVGDGHWTIQRELLDNLLGDPSKLARSARIVPTVRDGKPIGFKLYAIRPGSIYAVLGLRNGDTITAVNGMSIASPDRALRVYSKLRGAKKLTFALIRRGKGLIHTYEIIE